MTTLPDDFTEYTRRLMGDIRWQSLTASFDEKPPVSIRINPFKDGSTSSSSFISQFSTSEVPWCRNAFYLSGRPTFTADPLFHAGAYYVQEASSMFLDRVMRRYVTRPALMLDLCAAPGGKSTLARAALPDGSLLISNEAIRPRTDILTENMLKFGHPDVIVTNNYPADFSRCGIMFDVVLADVPCSGEGMFRKDNNAIGEWSVRNVERCRSLQRTIVTDIWDRLRPGALFIYSTCTFNTMENEENVRFIAEELGADILPVDGDAGEKHGEMPYPGITGSMLAGFDAPVYRFIPGMTRGEGLFMAVLRKRDNGSTSNITAKHIKAQRAANTKPDVPRHWIKNADNFRFTALNSSSSTKIIAVPQSWANIYDIVKRTLRIAHAGITIGEVKGRDIIPSQSLAMSIGLNADAFARRDVEYDRAIAYLRKESLTLPADTPRGNVLLTYNNRPLGFVKNIGNRANNLYPAEWRIRNKNI